MGKIILENIRVFSNHGCLDEEAVIGSEYLIDLEIETDLLLPASSDDLRDTVDYVHLNRIVREESTLRSKLLEAVAKRILDRLGRELPQITYARIRFSKLNPPIGGDVEKVSVVLEKNF